MADKVKGKTTSGFAFEIDSNVFKDWRFLRALRKANADGDDAFGSSMDMVAFLFNDQKQEDRFYDHLAAQNDDGRVPIEVVGKEVGEIMKIVQEKSKEAKN
ncbi:MAG: hypothetical protein II640_09120 [Lachnospiraceae bacterium]|nr:hypothetical protein [Lachnospiraceae bacterium]